MNLAVLSESSADEAAIQILVESVLGRPTELVGPPRLRSRGWPSVRQVLPAIVKHLHYRTNAEGLVVVVDSNGSPVHQPSHDQAEEEANLCRLCQLREIVRQVQQQLSPVENRAPIKIAVGLAVPAIEAWYCCGTDARVSEASWILGMQSRHFPYSKNGLKHVIYGSERPTLLLEEKRAIEEARRVAASLTILENLFPNGFGTLARDVRRW